MLCIFPPEMALEREKNLQVSYLKPQNDLATERTEYVFPYTAVFQHLHPSCFWTL